MVKYCSVLLCLALAVLVQAAPVEQVVNGSFEDGTVPPTSGWGFWDEVGAYWSFDTADPCTSAVLRSVGSLDTPWWGRLADDGDVFVALSNEASGSGWITQQLSGLEIGKKYVVNFSAVLGRPDETTPSTFQVYIGDTLISEANVMQWGWSTRGGTYTANSTDGSNPVLKLVHLNNDTLAHKLCFDAVSVIGPIDDTDPNIEHVVNGSFELGNAVEIHTGGVGYNTDDLADFWTYVASPSEDFVSYRVTGSGASPFYKAASDGIYYVALRNIGVGDSQVSWIEQDLQPLRVGQTYTVSWNVTLNPESNSGAVSDFAVMIGNTLIKREGVMRYGWYTYSFDYIANASDGVTPTIKLIHINKDGLDHRMLFDKVSVFGPRNDHADSCPGVIMAGDLDGNCYIDLVDLGLFVQGWLSCNEPDEPSCW